MCRTVHALLQTVICGIQMLVRVFMTVILMLENLIRMILQTLYNFISFMLQMLSLIPICVVFLLTARLKCFMCGGGGPCPVNRGGTCDCLMSGLAFVILFFIFRATGVLDKIFYSLGYAKAVPLAQTRFVATMGTITECSRNDTYFDEEETDQTDEYTFTDFVSKPDPNVYGDPKLILSDAAKTIMKFVSTKLASRLVSSRSIITPTLDESTKTSIYLDNSPKTTTEPDTATKTTVSSKDTPKANEDYSLIEISQAESTISVGDFTGETTTVMYYLA